MAGIAGNAGQVADYAMPATYLLAALPQLSWSNGFLIFAAAGLLFAVDWLSDVRYWLRNRDREGRLPGALAAPLARVGVLDRRG